MNWGNSILNDAGARVSPTAMTTDAKAFPKIGTKKDLPCDDMAKKRVIDLDMGEASREQGFRLNGCR